MSTVEIDYLEDRGPGIAELPAAGDSLPPPPPSTSAPGEETLPGWEQETIETFLQGTGSGIHMLIGQSERDWLMTRKDLERIAPPLTRIANRWEPALRLSPLADPLLVAHGFALYGWRSALEAKRAQRDAEEEALEGSPAAGYVREPVEPEEEEKEEPEEGSGALEDELDQAGYFDRGGTNGQ